MKFWRRNNKIVTRANGTRFLRCRNCPCGCLCSRFCPGANKPTGTVTVDIPAGEIVAPDMGLYSGVFDSGVCIDECWNQDGLSGQFILTNPDPLPCFLAAEPGHFPGNPDGPFMDQICETTSCIENLTIPGDTELRCGCWRYQNLTWYQGPRIECWDPFGDPEEPIYHALFMWLALTAKCPQPQPPDLAEFRLSLRIQLSFVGVSGAPLQGYGSVFTYSSGYVASEHFCHDSGYALSFCDQCTVLEGSVCPYYQSNEGTVNLFF